MNLEAVLARIPYLQVHRLTVEVVDAAIQVRMPLTEAITNHVGIVHAGALFTAAETAAGVAAYAIVPDDRAFVLLRGAEIRYTRRLEGDVVVDAQVASEQAEAALAAFDAEARAEARTEVTATDSEGETVFVGSFDYALRPRSS